MEECGKETTFNYKEVKSIEVNNTMKRTSKVMVDGINVYESAKSSTVNITVHGDVIGYVLGDCGDIKCGNVGESVSTTNGDITCQDVKSSVTTFNGDISARNIQGSAQTTNGDIVR